jgi:antitoxin MazE
MKVQVIRIGNSRGIRIPKTILQECHFAEEVELDVEDNRLIVRPVARARKGWATAFRKMHVHGDDALLDRDSLPSTRWDRSEWRW